MSDSSTVPLPCPHLLRLTPLCQLDSPPAGVTGSAAATRGHAQLFWDVRPRQARRISRVHALHEERLARKSTHPPASNGASASILRCLLLLFSRYSARLRLSRFTLVPLLLPVHVLSIGSRFPPCLVL
eukprot:4392592-Pleurochrysis_carterae.AAC.2